MTSKLRKALMRFLAEERISTMFGDGLESEYIWDGVIITGLNEMNETQLIEEFEMMLDCKNVDQHLRMLENCRLKCEECGS